VNLEFGPCSARLVLFVGPLFRRRDVLGAVWEYGAVDRTIPLSDAGSFEKGVYDKLRTSRASIQVTR
jgi:hypothetical protein